MKHFSGVKYITLPLQPPVARWVYYNINTLVTTSSQNFSFPVRKLGFFCFCLFEVFRIRHTCTFQPSPSLPPASVTPAPQVKSKPLTLFLGRVEDVPGLALISLKTAAFRTAGSPNTAPYESAAPAAATPLSATMTTTATTNTPSQNSADPASSPCPASPYGVPGRSVRAWEGLGDAWGGGVGGGWGSGLGVWRGLRGSLVGAREFLGHLKAYLGFYHKEEAAMYASLVEVRNFWVGQPRVLVVIVLIVLLQLCLLSIFIVSSYIYIIIFSFINSIVLCFGVPFNFYQVSFFYDVSLSLHYCNIFLFCSLY